MVNSRSRDLAVALRVALLRLFSVPSLHPPCSLCSRSLSRALLRALLVAQLMSCDDPANDHRARLTDRARGPKLRMAVSSDFRPGRCAPDPRGTSTPQEKREKPCPCGSSTSPIVISARLTGISSIEPRRAVKKSRPRSGQRSNGRSARPRDRRRPRRGRPVRQPASGFRHPGARAGLFARLVANGKAVVVLPGSHDGLAYPDSVFRSERFPGVDVLDRGGARRASGRAKSPGSACISTGSPTSRAAAPRSSRASPGRKAKASTSASSTGSSRGHPEETAPAAAVEAPARGDRGQRARLHRARPLPPAHRIPVRRRPRTAAYCGALEGVAVRPGRPRPQAPAGRDGRAGLGRRSSRSPSRARRSSTRRSTSAPSRSRTRTRSAPRSRARRVRRHRAVHARPGAASSPGTARRSSAELAATGSRRSSSSTGRRSSRARCCAASAPRTRSGDSSSAGCTQRLEKLREVGRSRPTPIATSTARSRSPSAR